MPGTALFPRLRGLWPAVAISVLAYFPFVYLPVVAQLRRLDPALEDVAASLGKSPARVFLRVVLPQLRLAITGGALLIALHLLAEYGLYVLIRFDTLTTAIVNQFQAVYDGPAANLLGIVLVACALGVLGLEAWLRGDRRYARVGAGAARPSRRACALGRAWPLWMLLPLATTALSVGAAARRRWCAGSGAAAPTPGTGPRSARRFGQTAIYALAGAALACLAALPIAWMSARAPGRLQRVLEGLPSLRRRRCPASSSRWRWWRSPSGWRCRSTRPSRRCSPPTCCSSSPRAIVALRASLAQVPVELEQAAVALGRPPLAAALGTTLRLAAPGHRRRHGAGRDGHHHRAHRDADAEPDRHRRRSPPSSGRCTGEFDHVGAAPFALAMVLLSLPLCVDPLPAGARARSADERPAHPRPRQALRRRRRARRHRPRRRGGHAHRRRRPVGLGQDHAAAPDRRVRGARTPARSCSTARSSPTATPSVPPHRRNIGLVMQDGALFPHLSVLDNIRFGMDRERADDGARALAAAGPRRARPRRWPARQPHELSGGQQQRVALARALARRPRPDAARRAVLGARRRPARADARRRPPTSSPRPASRPSSSPTTRRRRWASPTSSWCCATAGLIQAGPPRELYLAPADRETAAFLGPAIVLPAMLGGGLAHCSLGAVPLPRQPAGGGDNHAAPRADRARAGAPPRGAVRPARLLWVAHAGPVARVTLSRMPARPDSARLTM